SPVHGHCIEYDTQSGQPEVPVGHLHRIQVSSEDAWNEPIEHAKGQQTVPAKGTNMHVSNCPVSEMGNSIYIFKTEHWPFKSGHTVRSDCHYQEFKYHIFTNLVPCAAKREQAV